MDPENLPLLDHFKLRAEVNSDHTIHAAYVFNHERRVRERVRTKWTRTYCLGEGVFGEVWKEVSDRPDAPYGTRAVKIIKKDRMRRFQVDYRKELLALTKFSKNNVLYK